MQSMYLWGVHNLKSHNLSALSTSCGWFDSCRTKWPMHISIWIWSWSGNQTEQEDHYRCTVGDALVAEHDIVRQERAHCRSTGYAEPWIWSEQLFVAPDLTCQGSNLMSNAVRYFWDGRFTTIWFHSFSSLVSSRHKFTDCPMLQLSSHYYLVLCKLSTTSVWTCLNAYLMCIWIRHRSESCWWPPLWA